MLRFPSTPTYLRCIADQTQSKYEQPTLYRRQPRCTPAQQTTCGEMDHPRPFFNRLKNLSYIHTRRPTNRRSFPTNFYGLVGYDRVKITRSDWRAYLSPINPRCFRAVSLMHPRSNPALPDLHPSFRLTNPRSVRPTPTYSWCNHAHYSQYRTNHDLISTPGLKWIIQANVMPGSVPKMRTLPILLNIYNGIISPSLNPAKFFNSIFDNLCHEVVPGSWINHTRSDLKGGGANPVP